MVQRSFGIWNANPASKAEFMRTNEKSSVTESMEKMRRIIKSFSDIDSRYHYTPAFQDGSLS